MNNDCDTEIYGMLYIGSDNVDPIIVLHCFTPNDCFPPNRNVSLSHLSSLVVSLGLKGLLDYLQNLTYHSSQVDPQLMRAWNRVMIKEFPSNFPELCQDYNLNENDIALVKQWLDKNSEQKVKPETFKFMDISQASTIACDNDGRDAKRQRIGSNLQHSTKRDHITDYELHRKKRSR